MQNNLGLYIHIPYCKSKCPYCDFYSLRAKESDYMNYVQILNNKIRYFSKQIHKKVDTIYFGGGTPSVLGANLLCDILNNIKCNFNVDKNAEITFEVNPASGKFFDFNKVFSSGFNRISIGVQSANTNELKCLGRIHNNEDVLNTVSLAKNAGFSNISVDLMMGIPHQTMDSLKKSIDFCVDLDITHISSYILKIEENTNFYKRKDILDLPDDDFTSDLYLFAVDYLKEKGFNQYEISNFSKSNFESKHNLKYWKLEDYLGIGPGAHSFMDGKRFFYEKSIEEFNKNSIIYDGVGGTKDEYFMLRMRLTEGLNLYEYEKVFGISLTKDFKNKLNLYINNGFIERNNNIIAFTSKGMLVSNTILSDLLLNQ